MDVTFAVIADAANLSREGKLNLLGIFNVLHAAQFPAVHPQMSLVLTLEATAAEMGQTKAVEVQLVDPDGKSLGAASGRLVVPTGEAGYPVQLNHILPLAGVRFARPGDHAFHILINGETKTRVPLLVRPIPPTAIQRPA